MDYEYTGETYILHFPGWVRLLSRFSRRGNDGLTRWERSFLAREYMRGAKGR